METLRIWLDLLTMAADAILIVIIVRRWNDDRDDR